MTQNLCSQEDWKWVCKSVSFSLINLMQNNIAIDWTYNLLKPSFTFRFQPSGNSYIGACAGTKGVFFSFLGQPRLVESGNIASKNKTLHWSTFSCPYGNASAVSTALQLVQWFSRGEGGCAEEGGGRDVSAEVKNRRWVLILYPPCTTYVTKRKVKWT